MLIKKRFTKKKKMYNIIGVFIISLIEIYYGSKFSLDIVHVNDDQKEGKILINKKQYYNIREILLFVY